MNNYDVVVIGGGPAGLEAAYSSSKRGFKTLLIEREAKLGGILKQCIHDGFGLIRFKELLTGPEYAHRYISLIKESNADILTLTFVLDIKEIKDEGFIVKYINREGLFEIKTTYLIMATGCRERTSKQIGIHGSRPVGIFTAGTAQYYTNMLGYIPCRKCIILGSGDIGLIMARRLTLEGVKVLGVYEIKNEPSGLTRNIVQCLNDYNIPLYLNKTATRVFGEDRLTGVEIASVDNKLNIIPNTEEIIECDGLILSVGLIPENELIEKLGIDINNVTKGPIVDQNFMTTHQRLYACGNAVHVNDLVDYVSESAKIAAESIGNNPSSKHIDISINENMLYVVPSRINVSSNIENIVVFFRSKKHIKKCMLKVVINNELFYTKKYSEVNPPEMERIILNLSNYKNLNDLSSIHFILEEVNNE